MSEGNYRLKREVITDFMKQRMPTLCETEKPLKWWLDNRIVPNDEDLEPCEGNTDKASAELSINYDGVLAPVASENRKEVLICNNCKEYWIAPVDRCDCGSTTLTRTHGGNYKLARNWG